MATYVIEKDNHSSGFGIGFLGNDVRFTASLDSTCLYDVSKWEDKDKKDINKLYGFTNGLSDKHSARFGWRCIDNSYFEIVTYIHDGGDFIPGSEVVLGKAYPGVEFKCRLRNIGKLYIFNFNNVEEKISKTTNPSWIRLQLKFYFGGNNPAPHTMFCFIN